MTIHTHSTPLPLPSPRTTKARSGWLSRSAGLALAGMVFVLPNAQAADGTWISLVDGTWSVSANWQSNQIADGIGATANITADITGGRTVTINTTSRTLGILNLGDPNETNRYTIDASDGAGLTFDNGVSPAQLNNLTSSSSANIINVPISLVSSLNVANSTSSQLTLNSSSTISASTAGTKTLTNEGTGSGVVRLNGIISDGAGTVAIVQNSATSDLQLAGNNSFTGGLTVKAGTVLLTASANSPGASAITLGDTGGSSNAALRAQGRAISNNINLGSTSGTLVIGTQISGASNFSGAISGNNSLTLDSAVGTSLTISGTQNYTGVLSNASTSNGTVNLSGELTSNVTGVTQNSALSTMTISNSSNAFTGTTTVTLGTLVANNDKALGNSSLNINGGILDVRGTTANSVTLGTNSNLAFSEGDILLQLGTSFDTIVSSGSGAFTITGGEFVLDVTGTGFSYGNTYAVLQGFGGSNTVSGLTFSGYDTVNYVASLDTDGVLSFDTVPEPGTCTLLGLGLGLVLRRRRWKN